MKRCRTDHIGATERGPGAAGADSKRERPRCGVGRSQGETPMRRGLDDNFTAVLFGGVQAGPGGGPAWAFFWPKVLRTFVPRAPVTPTCSSRSPGSALGPQLHRGRSKLLPRVVWGASLRCRAPITCRRLASSLLSCHGGRSDRARGRSPCRRAAGGPRRGLRAPPVSEIDARPRSHSLNATERNGCNCRHWSPTGSASAPHGLRGHVRGLTPDTPLGDACLTEVSPPSGPKPAPALAFLAEQATSGV
jgi:hypothetical protein